MRSIRRILVAVKEPAARATPAAVKKAVQLARALGARLELFHALTAPIYADTFIYGDRSFSDITRAAQQQAEKRLQALAARLQGRGRRLRISVAAEWDMPAYEAIIRRAQASKADLIVAERHAGRHIAPGLLHLNDWELLRLSAVPVLLVKKSGLYDRPVVLAAVDPGRRHAKPAGLDAKILAVGSAVSGALRGLLYGVHAYVPVPGGTRPTDALDSDTAASINARMAAGARHRFERALAGVRIPRSRRLLIGRPPIEAISQAASDIGSDIVVMGAVSHSGLRRWILDDTAEGLFDQLSCDLLIVKPARFKSDIARRTSGARLVPAMPLIP
ncbi:MAG TPA: universal stress protein [Steroidobacteraceae bacterium]|jgi:universal stress protein E|nr:universal stress protein [Steroidobacteraceae bacterium]